ncbi:hypothetical protein FDP41_003120 [Naegleria fowleri]|uniref:Uncharacterized protein n=1 Tax=Naegleria fowleri TaxID=5763 RepID=A0A6A5BV42_NAEFO|nr:uncharacterized protein FDP41_003120 [Naegleria fowleri]KAF0977798.1 hypothetical protein FDP41_003120 [Naegleria fowleri]CAG4712416.1 unnamed protein product [Naegleria fowleri]
MTWITTTLRTLLGLTTVQSTSFFLGPLKCKVHQWVFFNACAVANLTFLCGLAMNSPLVMNILNLQASRIGIHAALPGMMYYGGLGLIVFPWRLDFSLIPQFSHTIMTLNVARELNETLSTGDYQNGFLGLALGLLFWLPFICWQNKYFYTHPEEAESILFQPEKRMKELQEKKN